MVALPLNRSQNDDPRKLRDLHDRVVNLADDHQLVSVAVGMSAPEGDLLFPEIVDFVASELRVDDSIFRMTRNRAVFFLADADRGSAQEIMDRVLSGFHEHFTAVQSSAVELSYFEVGPGGADVTLKEVLPALFAGAPECGGARPQ